MIVSLPAVRAVDEKVPGLGTIRQMAADSLKVECTSIRHQYDRDAGHALQLHDGSLVAIVFPRAPRYAAFAADACVLVSPATNFNVAELDLSDGRWNRHSAFGDRGLSATQIADSVRRSWGGAFQYVEEGADGGQVALRKPQMGALHAIHAHWSTSSEPATIVMPTGTGKTETMLATLVSATCERVLVVVPTDALRTQIADKFESLGILKHPRSTVLSDSARRPVVGVLTSCPRSPEDVERFFCQCNVVVTTSALAGRCTEDVQARIARECSHLFIDEAHHSEAPTWKAFRAHFVEKRVLQFTATPFREDGQRIDGKLVYVYPLRMAQAEGYFTPIRFRQVYEWDSNRGDQKIAEAALAELDADATGKHIVMARVGSVDRASRILALYQGLGRHPSVAIHSKLTAGERTEAERQLRDRTARVVVCVDMLGEGFDMPELKIAAFHDIRKSLAVTLQLAGRFTRTRADLGAPVFIANTALIDVSEELRNLYAQDPDWNVLLPDLSKAAIDQELASQEFFQGFAAFLKEIPLPDLRPAASMVAYKTRCRAWSPDNYRKGLRGLTARDKVYHSLNSHMQTLVLMTLTEQGVQWSDVESVQELTWDLYIAVWDSERDLLYIHGSGKSGEYRELAKALCGDDVQLMVAPEVYRCFYGVKRLVLNNVGLDEHLGRQVRYTGRMGSDVEARIGQAARRTAKKIVLAGTGYEAGERVTVGAAKRGRVWSSERLRVDTFATWARTVGTKLVDESVNPDQVLAGTLKPAAVLVVPTGVAIAADWPLDILERAEEGTQFLTGGTGDTSATFVDIEVVAREESDPVVVRVFTDGWESRLALRLFSVEEDADFRFEHIDGARLQIRRGTRVEPLADYFTEHPPVVWFADGSALEGCQYTLLPQENLLPYAPERLREMDWGGVDLRRESQGREKLSGTIQHRLIQFLQGDDTYSVIFDDDGPNEAADVIAIREVREGEKAALQVELYHCKFAGGAPGRRVEDLYAVCGQAQRSTCWLASREKRTQLFLHLLKRDAARVNHGHSSRFERGDTATLRRIADQSRRLELRLRIFVVQPGLSKANSSASQMTLLAVTERYLTDTYNVPFEVLCSA